MEQLYVNWCHLGWENQVHFYYNYFISINDYEKDISNYRLSLDYKEDYIVIKSIFESLYPKNPYFTLENIISWLEKNPEIQKINSHFRPSEGIFKSFKQDKEAGF